VAGQVTSRADSRVFGTNSNAVLVHMSSSTIESSVLIRMFLWVAKEKLLERQGVKADGQKKPGLPLLMHRSGRCGGSRIVMLGMMPRLGRCDVPSADQR